MATYATRTCVNCQIRRPAYDMKQEYVKEISGRSGYSVSFSPLAGKGKVGKSIRVHTGRTYTSNRKIWLCKTLEGCHNLDYYDNQRALEKENNAYNAYASFLTSKIPSYIDSKKFLNKFTEYFIAKNPTTEDIFLDLKNNLKKIIKELKPLLIKNSNFNVGNIVFDGINANTKISDKLPIDNYGIIAFDFNQILQNFQKELTVDTTSFKSHKFKNFKDSKGDMYGKSFFSAVMTLDVAIFTIIFFSIIGFFSDSILGWVGVDISTFSIVHISIISFFTLASSAFAIRQHKISKPFVPLLKKWKALKLKEKFNSIDKIMQDSFSEFYLMCALHYLTDKTSLNYNIDLYEKDVDNNEKKEEFRRKYIHRLCQDILGDNYNHDKLSVSYSKFLSIISKKISTNKVKKTKSEKKASSKIKKKKSAKNWSKSDYIRLYYEDDFLEIATLLLALNIANQVNGIDSSEMEVLISFGLNEYMEILNTYPQGNFKYNIICSFLKKKYPEEVLISIINNLFCISEADHDINEKEINRISEFSKLMGISNAKFKLIKEDKLKEEKPKEKDRKPLYEDHNYDEKFFDDIDFDDVDF